MANNNSIPESIDANLAKRNGENTYTKGRNVFESDPLDPSFILKNKTGVVPKRLPKGSMYPLNGELFFYDGTTSQTLATKNYVDTRALYVYTAYATDSNGTGWTLTYAEGTTVYTATISSNVELDPPIEADFAGATWIRNTGLNGVTVPVDTDITEGSANAAESDATYRHVGINVDDKAVVIVGKNKFNPNNKDVRTGYYVSSSSGVLASNANYTASGYIPVEESLTYTLSYKHQIAWYDEDRNYISGSSSADTNKTQTAPAGAKYLRCSILNTSLSTFQVELGSAQSAYEAYYIPEIKDYKPDNPSFIATKIGKNLLNPLDNDVHEGGFINSSGGINSHPNFCISGYIPINNGQTIIVNYAVGGTYQNLYDSNKNLISSVNSNQVTGTADGQFVKLSVVGTGDKYYWDSVKVQAEYGTSITPYVSPVYFTYLKDTISRNNEISLPSTFYVLTDKQNNIYFKQMLKNVDTDRYFARIKDARNYKEFGRFDVGMSLPTSLRVDLFDAHNEFNIIDSKSAVLVQVNESTDNGSINHLAIGDSYTHGGKYLKQVYDRLTNVNIVGTRQTDNVGSYPFRYEGRGGWTLDNYSQPYNSLGFSPFVHPTNKTYNYYGSTSFWYNVKNDPSGYNYQYFQAIESEIGFNVSTGLLAAPSVNDLMFDDQSGADDYVYWNGSAWVSAGLTDNDFEIDFQKYVSIYSIDTPDIISVLLGLNDFRNIDTIEEVNILFDTWKIQMDDMIAKAKIMNANINFIIALPNSYCGSLDNNGYFFTVKQNRNMWEARNLIIDEYDNRTSENIYISDTGTSVDPDFSFETSTEVPFEEYTGGSSRVLDFNTPHPNNDGYAQIGTRIISTIQHLR